MFKSVFAKYITTFMLIIFVSFLLLVLLITAMVNNYAVNAKKKLLDNTADFAAGYLSDRMESGNTESDAFAKMILRMSGDVDRMLLAGAGMGDDITLLLVDKNGRILRMASGGKAAAGSASLPRSVIDEVNSGVAVSEISALSGVFDEPQFFCVGHPFDGDLTAQGRRLVRQFFPVYQRQRQVGTGVSGTLAAAVDGQTALHIPGDAGVQGAVAAAEDIDPVGRHAAASF